MSKKNGNKNEDKNPDKNQKKFEKKEDKNKANTLEPKEGDSKPEESQKKEKTLRFKVPAAQDFSSEESFMSAFSYTIGPDEEFEDTVDVSEKEIHSFLRKYTLVPLRYSQPRSASLSRGCRKNDRQSAMSLFSSSSRQLFEIETQSPTLSDANINLLNATYRRKLDAVKEALLEGADINTHRDRLTPLLIAVEHGDDHLVSYLLTVPNINANFQNNFGQTPLFVAVKNSFDRIVKHLLNHSADVNIADNLGRTPLFAAVFQKRLKLTKVLLVYGSNCDKQDLFGETPVDASVLKAPDLDCLLTLLKVGASPETVNLSGTPLLSRAILCFTDIRIIEALVSHGAAVNRPDHFTRKTPLHFAAITDNLTVAKFLVAHGADVNRRSSYGFTPFDEAHVHNNASVAEYLSFGAAHHSRDYAKWPKKGKGAATLPY